ncbi:hypothetical protein M8C21_019945, partial [Ambrosia artemisiifolia]
LLSIYHLYSLFLPPPLCSSKSANIILTCNSSRRHRFFVSYNFEYKSRGLCFVSDVLLARSVSLTSKHRRQTFYLGVEVGLDDAASLQMLKQVKRTRKLACTLDFTMTCRWPEVMWLGREDAEKSYLGHNLIAREDQKRVLKVHMEKEC